MSSTASGVHTLNIRDTGARARIDVWDAHTCEGMIGVEASSSSLPKPVGESSVSGTRSVQASGRSGTGSPPPSPTRANATPALCLPSSASVAADDDSVAAQRDLRRTRIPSPPQLQSIYGLWSTYSCDKEDSRIPPPFAQCLDGDIFGVGKRPVQHEIETDGCVRLVFVVEEPVD